MGLIENLYIVGAIVLKTKDMGKKRIKSNNVETDYYKKYQRKKKLQEPINEYTITMDVKFLDDISKSKLFVLILFFFFSCTYVH